MLRHLLRAFNKPKTSKIVLRNSGEQANGIPSGIVTMSPSGGEITRVNQHGNDPEWSPDGSLIAFSSRFDGYKPYARNIAVMRPDGSAIRQLTHHKTGAASNPFWSPDSNKIAYYVYEDGVEHQIWSVDLRTGEQFQLATGGVSPIWTPSDEIVFEANDGWHPLMIMTSQGKDIRKCSLFEDGDWAMRWSRSGDNIAFLREQEIYVMNSDGSRTTRIREGRVATGLTWSPDGQHIAYYGENSEQPGEHGKEVFVIGCDGSNERKILANPWCYQNEQEKLFAPLAEFTAISWSPFL
jgi:Tol biopolymer transport system component